MGKIQLKNSVSTEKESALLVRRKTSDQADDQYIVEPVVVNSDTDTPEVISSAWAYDDGLISAIKGNQPASDLNSSRQANQRPAPDITPLAQTPTPTTFHKTVILEQTNKSNRPTPASDSSHKPKIELTLMRSWRSVLHYLTPFILFSIVTIGLSNEFPGSVLSTSFSFLNSTFILKLPIFVFIPAALLIRAFYLVYRYKLFVSGDKLIFYNDRSSFRTTSFEMNTDAILFVQLKESIVDRLLGIGNIQVGRFSRGNVEIELKGIAKPRFYSEFFKTHFASAKEGLSGEESNGETQLAEVVG